MLWPPTRRQRIRGSPSTVSHSKVARPSGPLKLQVISQTPSVFSTRLTRSHPGIAFRDGPASRRPTLLGGPDVWEVISAARSAPERGDQLIAALAERLGTTPEKIRVATPVRSAACTAPPSRYQRTWIGA